jgi:hypothetical protein
MYPEIQQLITVVTVGVVLVLALGFAQLVLAWWRCRHGE